MDIIKKILDDQNTDDILLTNEETGEELLFEQIATIPYEETTYAILSPKESNEDFEVGEGLVFKIINIEGDDLLVMEEDEQIIDKIFDIYEDLYREQYGDIVIETE